MDSRSVLLVDDSIVSRVVLRKYIASVRPFWMCIEVCRGEDALAVAQHLRFDLAIVDFNMPGIDGLDTARALKRMQSDLVIAMLTGDAGVVMQRCVDSGAYHFFEKPVSQRKARAIVGLLDG